MSIQKLYNQFINEGNSNKESLNIILDILTSGISAAWDSEKRQEARFKLMTKLKS
tara:strand:+ start:254 stop:418 length:165 start_codon:yes stop_codon:yes gene_type:complete